MKYPALRLTPPTRLLEVEGLRPVQARALAVLADAQDPDGLFLGAGVGFGKTLVGLLAGGVLGAKRPLYLTRSKLVPQVLASRDHWALDGPPGVRDLLRRAVPRVVGYGALSSITTGEGLLESLRPDLLILDEAHELGSPQAARTRRVEDYLTAHQDTRVVVMTGTITRRSLLDMAHLLAWALPHSEVGRLSYPVLVALDSIIAPGGEPDEIAWSVARGLVRWAGTPSTVAGVREAFRRLLVSTPGVLLTTDAPTQKGLSLEKWTPPLPGALAKALTALGSWELPDGREIVEATEHARARSSLALGFYYARPDPAPEVQRAKDAWSEVLKRHLRRPYNSPGLVSKAAKAGDLGAGARRAAATWRRVKGRWPRGVAVWLARDIIEAAWAWAQDGPPTVIWCATSPVLEAFRALGAPCFGAGSAIPQADLDPHVVASSRVHGTGSNLDGYPRALVIEPPSGGASWEQLIGRHHRPGREDDEGDVSIWVYARPWNMARSIEDAGYLGGVTGSPQKLLTAKQSTPTPQEGPRKINLDKVKRSV